jgi:hypothetical protein
MVAKTDIDFEPYERDMAEFFDAGRKAGKSETDTARAANRARANDLREEQQAAQRRREAQTDANRVSQQTSC